MAFFPLPKLRRFASKLESLRGGFSRKADRKAGGLKPRRLVIDPLEERQLLSLSPADFADTLVNQVVSEASQSTLASQSVASDDDGDFLVAWTRYDPVLDPTTGGPVIDPATGQPMTDANIYARYFTDEVQRLTLPPEIVANNVPGQFGSFTLVAGGNEVQKLSITPTYEPFTDPFLQDSLDIDFKIGFDLDGNGSIGGAETTQTIFYNEFAGLDTNAKQIEVQLQGLGGQLTDVSVQPINPHEFEIHFGDASLGLNQPELVIDPTDITVNSGFLPAITVDTLREPTEIGPIVVSPDDPNLTATSIEQSFLLTTTDSAVGPIDFPPPSRVPPEVGPRFSPDNLRSAAPGVTVTPLSTTEFDITFDGNQATWEQIFASDITIREGTAGKKDHPELVVESAADDLGTALSPATFDVTTLKEPSQEFRVNPEEPDDPFTPLPDRFDQTRPAVAMDADGEFVITWQSEIPDSQNFGSITDVFARRFTGVGMVDPSDVEFFVDSNLDGVAEDPVQGVKALVTPQAEYVQLLSFDAFGAPPLVGPFQFRVDDFVSDEITFDSNDLQGVADQIKTQLESAGQRDVAVTVVSGTDPYQFEIRFRTTFKSAVGPREAAARTAVQVLPGVLPAFASTTDLSGDLLTFRVNTDTTNAQGQPAVGMDDHGGFVVAWGSGGQEISFFNDIRAQRYDRDGQLLGTEFIVNNVDTNVHLDPAVALSPDGNFVVTWSRSTTATGAVAVFFKAFDSAGLQLLPQTSVGGGGSSSVSFDRGNNFFVSWSLFPAETDNIGIPSTGVRAQGYTLLDAQGNPSGAVFRPAFAVNSADFNTGRAPLWPLSQFGAQIAADADGDLIASYEGFGPDTSDDVSISSTFFQDALNDPANADLAALFPFGIFLFSSTDVDAAIEQELIAALNAGATNEQVGRLRKLLDDAAGLLRGEANGIMVSVLDARPGDPLNILSTDDVTNAERSGHNQRYFITVSTDSTGGSFTLRLFHPNRAGFEDVQVSPVYNNNVLNVTRTATAIETALRGAQRTGVNWPVNVYEGPVDVRLVQSGFGFFSQEILDRQGTPWDLVSRGVLSTDAVYEVTFQGEVHDTEMTFFVQRNQLSAQNVSEVQTLTFQTADTGFFALDVGGSTTNDIFFDPTAPGFPTAVAQQIQNELVALGFNGVTVIALPGGPPFQFQVVFGGASAGTNQPPILSVPPLASPAYPGFIFSITDQQGGGQNAPPPTIIEHTVADDGITQTGASIAVEPDGDFVVAWTQNEEFTPSFTSNQNIYYRRFVEDTDTAGPQITDVFAHKGIHVENGDVVESPVTHLVVSFDEKMTAAGVDSVTDPANYVLRRDGVELPGGIVAIQFGMNKAADLAGTVDPLTGTLYDVSDLPTNKWEAVFTLDGNGVDPGIGPLEPGLYTIEAVAAVDSTPITPAVTGLRDQAGNPLGFNGFNPNGVDFSRDFVVPVPQRGDTPVTGAAALNPRTFPESAEAVAVDADGDHVVAWTAFDTTLGRERVFVRLFDGTGSPAATSPVPFQVTPFADAPDFAGDDQRFGAVAADKDGDFIVTWTNYRDADGDPGTGVNGREEEDIYARRYSADGTPENDPFLVNTFTFGKQRLSSVAVDTDGDFLVAWSSYGQEGAGTGQPGLGYGVYARLYDSTGAARGPEFLVNQTIQGNQGDPAAAVDSDGDFVVVWTGDQGGTDDVFARVFAADGTPTTPEAQVNTTAAGNQNFPDVAFDLPGRNFVVTWTGSGDQDGDGFGVFARAFDFAAAINPLTPELQVNTSTTGDQMFSSVAMNHPGDFVVAWSGLGDQPFQEDLDQSGIFFQRFDFDPATGATPSGGEIRANVKTEGSQQFASVDGDGEGNFAVVWTGDGAVPGTTEVFRFLSTDRLPVVDAVGPIVTDVLLSDRTRVFDGQTVTAPGPGLSQMIVLVGEQLSIADDVTGLDSVLNPDNWVLKRNGSEVLGAITSITFSRNLFTRKYEAVLNLDGNGLNPGTPPLPLGNYTLVARDTITDGVNRLDGDFDGVPGSNPSGPSPDGFQIDFTLLGDAQDDPIAGVATAVDERTFPESAQAVAVDADGDHVVTWTAFDTTLGRDRVFWRIFDADGSPAGSPPVALQVSPVGDFPAFQADDQRFATVAADADGDFVVTWTNYRGGDADIYARRFSANGTALSDPFLVNTYGAAGSASQSAQKWSNVAMDVDGDFVVTWSSLGQEDNGQLGFGYGVYARRFDSFGVPLAPEFQVNVTEAGNQQISSVAMDAQGGFFIAWTSDQNGVGDDIVGRWFNADGSPLAGPLVGEIIVNTTTAGNQRYPDVAMDLAGSQAVVTWSSRDQDGSGWGVFGRTLQRVGTAGAEFQVNTTTTGNQVFSSVAADHRGVFTVTWSGRGDVLFQEDNLGVFYQRFDAAANPIGGETRVNQETDGVQGTASVGSDSEGNFVVVWTGDNLVSGTTQVFRFLSTDRLPVADSVGPIVTDVLNPLDGSRILDGDVVAPPSPGPGLGQIVVVFGEELSLVDGSDGLNSVLNPVNWTLEQNGAEIINGVNSVAFGRNPVSRKYEATLTLDGNGASPGIVPLEPGDYLLTASNLVTDALLNQLDGDFNTSTGPVDHPFRFAVAAAPQTAAEFRINEPTVFEQRFAAAGGTGFGVEQTTRTLAVDHDGDYVVVWNSYGQDDPSDPTGAGVFYRMYDRDNVPLTPERQANTTIAGDQRNASVAIDADGEFVVVWESEGQDADGSFGIYGQRYDSVGNPVGAEFQVNTTFTNNQLHPAVAMDDFGNYVVVWATAGQDFSFFNDIYAQRFDNRGEPQGLEFLVNDGTPPGGVPVPGNVDVNPTVAMSGPIGDFVVAWNEVTAQQNGVVTATQITAKIFDALGLAQAPQFAAATGGVQRNPQMVMDDQGGFLLVWESSTSLVGGDYNIFFQQFDNSGVAGASGQVNQVEFAGQQVNPSVAVDADGDFAVAFNGNGGQTDPLNPPNPSLFGDLDSEGVFLRSFNADATEISVQSRANRTEAGIQQFPSIGMTKEGDIVAVWSGRGVGDQHGIFGRRYDEPVDTAGPRMTEIRGTDGELVDDSQEINSPRYLVATLDEDMWTLGVDGVENVANWVLRRNEVELPDAVVRVQFGLNKASELSGQIDPLTGEVYGLDPDPTNKFEAVVTLDADANTAELDSIAGGNYTLTARRPIVGVQSGLRDAVGNPMGRTGLLPDGADSSLPFRVILGGGGGGGGGGGTDTPVTDGGAGNPPVTNGRTYAETRGAVASDADGDHVVVLTARDNDPLSPTLGLDRVYVRMFDADGAAAGTSPFLFLVTTEAQFGGDEQRFATVAADDDGDFIVTWTNYRDDDGDPGTGINGREQEDIFARRFRADGTAQGPSFRVNGFTAGNQKWSGVAADVDGDFVVTWSSYGQENGGQLGSGYGIYARRFDSFGQALGDEFQVNVTTAGDQQLSAVAMDSFGGFVVVWQSDQGGVGDDIYARVFNADGSPRIGPAEGEILVNNVLTDGNQRYPDVDVTPDGNNFVTTWTSSGRQDGSGDGVFGQLINIPLLIQQAAVPPSTIYVNDPGTTGPFSFGNPVISTVTVPTTFPNNFTVADVDLNLTIFHPLDIEVEVFLISPSGTQITVFQNVPRDPAAAFNSSDFFGTLINDEGFAAIEDPTPGVAVAPFLDPRGYIPQQPLATFDGQNSSGTWRLVVQDTIDSRQQFGFPQEFGGTLQNWSLTLTRVPDRSGEFLVNSSTTGNQGFSSVAMNHQGSFTVAWSGRGDQDANEDLDGGIFYQQFDLSLNRLGGETRANLDVDGNQIFPSIDADGEGNFVIVWTGEGATVGTTDVFRFLSTDFLSTVDLDGPRVTDVLLADGTTRVIDGDVLVPPPPGVSELVVDFGEDLSIREGATGLDSVLNPENFVLERGGSEITGAVTDVTFGRNPDTRKFEAVLTLDGNGLDSGTPPLPSGDYVLTVREEINDLYTFDPVTQAGQFFLGNALDGDFDGSPGTSPTGTGFPGFKFRFSVADSPTLGAEFRVNESPTLVQRLAEPQGTGLALEESTRSVAVDHDGDFAVAWTSYGQDDPTDPSGGGVYLRLFDRNNNPLTGEIQVNTTTAGHQRDAAVAIDADGEIVVVWESQGQDPDGTYGVYGRRFSSIGTPLGGEFRVNTNIANNQLNPAVAMGDEGNFTVLWATASQAFDFSNDIRGQVFNDLGQRQGSEFLVNSNNLPGVSPPPGSGFEINPAIAMAGPTGDFVAAWDVVTAQQSGVITDSVIAARQFAANGTPLAPEFQANTVGAGGTPQIARVARNPQLAMDNGGNFIVVWEGFGADDIGPSSYGVFYQRFDAAGGFTSSGQVNDPNFSGQQVNPSVGGGVNGDFAIVWDGVGGQPDPLDPTNPDLHGDLDRSGVFLRQYDATATPISVQSRVNKTEPGVQQFASIGVEPDRDAVVVWAGNGVGDRHGVFARRFDNPIDNVGPIVSDLVAPGGSRIPQGAQVTQQLTHLVVVFDEEMATTGANSVTNPANYRLLRNGTLLGGAIKEIRFGLNQAFADGLAAAPTNKWEAVLVLDGNGFGAGEPPLESGDYELVVVNNVRDVAGNPLGATGVNPNGASASRTFNLFDVTASAAGGETRVNTDLGAEFTRPHATQPVASDAEGDYVTVWENETPGVEGIYAKVVDVTWTKEAGERVSTETVLGEFPVTAEPTARFPSVARDGDGDFVVTWSQQGPTDTDWDVYAQRFDAVGTALGGPFRVNSEVVDVQRFSTVAMDIDGDFVIAWQSRGQDGDGYGIFAQRYSPAGEAIGGTNEVQTLHFAGNPVGTFTLGFEGGVTGTIAYGGNPFAITDTIEAELLAIGAEVKATAIDLNNIEIRFVGPDGLRDRDLITVEPPLIVGDPGAQITVLPQSDGATGEFRVNDTVANDQVFPNIAMDSEGAFVVTWTGFGQDGDAADESNIYAKQFVGNDAFRGSQQPRGPRWVTPFIVTTDPQPRNIVPPDAGFDGVVELQVTTPQGIALGSGSLLATGRHILTAAHVVADQFGNLGVTNAVARFDLASGPVFINASQIFIDPAYNGNIADGNDLAIIVLDETAPPEANRYDIYRAADEVGKVFEKVGYGASGDGNTGAVIPASGIKRDGLNRYDSLGGIFGSPFGPLDPNILVFDFDNGLAANDAFGVSFGISDLGVGANEVNTAPGDSGGPAFINGLIAGVTSGGFSGFTADVTPFTDSSFGEFSIDARVSVAADWIDMITQSTGPEFLVNQNAVDPVTGAVVDNQTDDQKWSTVALDADGDFVITWTSYGQDGVGTGYGSGAGGVEGVFARRYLSDGTAVDDAFQVNTFAENQQQFSRIGMDADGDFVITWESFQDVPPSPADAAPDSFGIYARRYLGTDSYGQVPLLDPTGNPVLDPITGLPVTTLVLTDPFAGPNGEIGGEFAVNTTKAGDQRYPGATMDDTGDFLIVWSGRGDQVGQADAQGIFQQRFEKPEDDAGPTVTNLENVVGTGGVPDREQILQDDVLQDGVSRLLVTFGEELDTTGGALGAASVLNLNHWQLTKDGQVLPGGVAAVEFGLNQAFVAGIATAPSNKFEAVLTLDGDPGEAGLQTLGRGDYVLTIRDAIEDLFENRLDGDFDGAPGGSFTRDFTVVGGVTAPLPGPGTPGPTAEDERVNEDPLVVVIDAGTGLVVPTDQDNPAVARTADGDYVVAWVDRTEPAFDDAGVPILDPFGSQVLWGDIKARLFDRFGQPKGSEFLVASDVAGPQDQPDVAIDDFGNFVVAWSGQGQDDDSGIYARIFDRFGNPAGEEFLVNEFKASVQDDPAVAMDAGGDFAVTWTSYGQDGDLDGVFARRYSLNGRALTGEFQVNTTAFNRQEKPDVAMDAAGDFVVTWNSFGQDGSSWGVYARRFDVAGDPTSGEFRVNAVTSDKQVDPRIAMDDDGDFVVAFASFSDGSGYGVYARRYTAAGVALGSEFRVNETTLHWQEKPAVSMDATGDFVVTWTTFDQEDETTTDHAIFARMFNADGSDFIDVATGSPLGEFRINATIEGDQLDSDVAMDPDGHYTVVWEGPDFDAQGNPAGVGVYARVIDPPQDNSGGPGPDPLAVTLTGTDLADTFEFIAGAPGSWTVKVNGAAQNIGPGTRILTFDGGLGDDSVRFTGLSNSDRAELWPDHGVFTGFGYTVNVNSTESITVDTAGGDDTVLLHDSPGDDTLDAWPDHATFSGPGFSHELSGFESLTASATTGSSDTAFLHDSAGADHYYTDPTQAILSAADGSYELIAVGFPYVHGYALGGGFDTADMWDSSGNDSVYAYADQVKMIGETSFYFRRAKYFDEVTAHAVNGVDPTQWGDAAYLRDSADDDEFTASPAQATMDYNVQHPAGVRQVMGPTVTVVDFDYVHGYALYGGVDTAFLHDSPGDDTATFTPWYTKLLNETDPANTFFLRAKYFEYVHAYADSGGHDVARMYDSSRRDTFYGGPDSSRMVGVDYKYNNRARFFDEVYAYADAGGFDVAHLSDSPLKDHLEAALPRSDASHWAKVSSDPASPLDYLYYVQGFEHADTTSSNPEDVANVDPDAVDAAIGWLDQNGWF